MWLNVAHVTIKCQQIRPQCMKIFKRNFGFFVVFATIQSNMPVDYDLVFVLANDTIIEWLENVFFSSLFSNFSLKLDAKRNDRLLIKHTKVFCITIFLNESVSFFFLETSLNLKRSETIYSTKTMAMSRETEKLHGPPKHNYHVINKSHPLVSSSAVYALCLSFVCESVVARIVFTSSGQLIRTSKRTFKTFNRRTDLTEFE